MTQIFKFLKRFGLFLFKPFMRIVFFISCILCVFITLTFIGPILWWCITGENMFWFTSNTGKSIMEKFYKYVS